MKRRHWTAFFVFAAAGAFFDLLSKHFAFHHVRYSEVKVFEGDIAFSFGRTVNPGIVFGLGQEWGPLFLVISLLAVPLISWIYLRMRRPSWTTTVAMGLILAGTIGNLTDRLLSTAGFFEWLQMSEGEGPGVRDFIKFSFGESVWPLFNIADSCICVGVAVLALEMMFFDPDAREKKKGKTVPADGGVGTGGGGDETAPLPVAEGYVSEETEETPVLEDETAQVIEKNETLPLPDLSAEETEEETRGKSGTETDPIR